MAGLREKNSKNFPVKKVKLGPTAFVSASRADLCCSRAQLLLLLWKSLLATIGGAKDIERVKEFVREVESLPPDDKTKQGVPRELTQV